MIFWMERYPFIEVNQGQIQMLWESRIQGEQGGVAGCYMPQCCFRGKPEVGLGTKQVVCRGSFCFSQSKSTFICR